MIYNKTSFEKQGYEWLCLYGRNVETEKLTRNQILEVYRVRWPIELLFKSMKSRLDIDEFEKIGLPYLNCIIYGKLITLMLTTPIYNYYDIKTYKAER
ncbi:transposase [Anaeromicrobium sediminis]|uniref:Transposase IS4-like domain-containing protein n=1 Tax=Anaeromicrobium sediminis TaxID=1478221 RepID=A0A267MK29_9FIRM|nr:hypothetical protein CCE28_07995 [Anaeromicrobium sediminis]